MHDDSRNLPKLTAILTDGDGVEHPLHLPETDPASAALLEELMRIAGQGWKESAIDALGTSFQAKRCVVMAARSLYGRHWRQTSRSEVASALRGCGEIMFAASEAAKQWAIESTLLEVSVAISFDFPRVWDLLRFCIGSKNRERLFIPAYNDLLADYLESQLPKYQTPLARRWIQCCFGVRTAWLVAQCMAVGLRGAVASVVVPVALREWIRNWWYGG
jgi:hypothetical protein